MAIIIKCRNCKKEFKIYACRKGKKKYCSMECYLPNRIKTITKSGKISRYKKGNTSESKKRPEIMPRGKNHKLWKGESVGYRGLHYWIRRELGKPIKCLHCGEKDKKVDWANIDRKYKRIISDYIPLCKSCHKRYDLKLIKYGKI